ncbi:hypothetical protein POVWA2_049330 [Plasmodium ovale wallikeri]|uniref:Uncharacterized protein n=1 Tax=Plasmodium ovale wallikeri TaxID=864142 RepID=A0A1A8ZMR5_PLAOA|nr:hypothetical protein POVWA2_049330 [Plasmodium ovale wallikeri]
MGKYKQGHIQARAYTSKGIYKQGHIQARAYTGMGKYQQGHVRTHVQTYSYAQVHFFAPLSHGLTSLFLRACWPPIESNGNPEEKNILVGFEIIYRFAKDTVMYVYLLDVLQE